MTDLHWLGVTEAARAIAQRELSPVELTKALLDRVHRLDPKLHTFIRLDADAAMAAAKSAEAEIAANPGKTARSIDPAATATDAPGTGPTDPGAPAGQ